MTATCSTSPNPKAAFFVLAALCLAPLLPLPAEAASMVAPVALLMGAALALTLGNPLLAESKVWSRRLLQASVVLLGFSMDLGKVAEAGRSGLLFSLVSIASVFALGGGLTRFLKVRPVTGLLVSAGTAICGGSAIAAISSVVDAPEEDVSVAVGTVFLLNAVALLVFPPLGHRFGLGQRAFGTWAGLAIHDIASVVGAGTSYGPAALEEATAVKLSRVVYLVPVSLIAAALHRRGAAGKGGPVQVPWFVGLFLLASLSRGLVPALLPLTGDVKRVAAAGFALALFLVGAALTRETLRRVGVRPLVLGTVLWLAVSAASLVAVRLG